MVSHLSRVIEASPAKVLLSAERSAPEPFVISSSGSTVPNRSDRSSESISVELSATASLPRFPREFEADGLDIIVASVANSGGLNGFFTANFFNWRRWYFGRKLRFPG